MLTAPTCSPRTHTLFPSATLSRSRGDNGYRPVSFELPNGMIVDMSAFDYGREWAAPQFAFHHVAAYAVLRHMGVPLGKADYVGDMMRYLRPGTAPTA